LQTRTEHGLAGLEAYSYTRLSGSVNDIPALPTVHCRAIGFKAYKMARFSWAALCVAGTGFVAMTSARALYVRRDDAMTYEAEDAILSGVTVDRSHAGFSGKPLASPSSRWSLM